MANDTYDHVHTVETMISAFRLFAMIANSVPASDIRDAQETMQSVHSIGPILDPTRYRTALYDHRLDRQKAVIDLFTRTRSELQRIFPEGWAP